MAGGAVRQTNRSAHRRSRSGVEADRVGSVIAGCTSLALSAAGAVHIAWAAGSTFPFRTRSALNDAVIGRQATPAPVACAVVALLLGSAAGAVASAGRRHGPWSRVVAAGVAAVLGVRAAFGFAGRTAVLVPGSESPRFVRMDRRVFSPLCTLLAAGAATAAR